LPTNFDAAVFDPAVLDLLACPACHSAMQVRNERIVCRACGRAYPIIDGIPVLIADRAGKVE